MIKIKIFTIMSVMSFSVFIACKAQNIFIAEKFINNELIAKYYTKDDKVIKYIVFNKSLGKSEEINYKYDRYGKLTQVIFSPDNEISGSTRDMEIKYYEDELVQQEYLNKELGVNIPFENIIADDVSTITTILSSLENYSDTTIKNKRIISANNINKKYRFYPSEIENFISVEDTIKQYILYTENNVIKEEEILLNTGKFTRSYYWQDKNTYIIKIIFVSIDNEKTEQIKKIVLKKG